MVACLGIPKIVAKLLKYTGYLNGTLYCNVQTAVYNGFQEKLNGPLRHLAVVLRIIFLAYYYIMNNPNIQLKEKLDTDLFDLS